MIKPKGKKFIKSEEIRKLELALLDEKVLIVDDDKLYHRSLKYMLVKCGFRLFNIFSAYEGKSALELIKSHRFLMILIDIQMPGMSGLELIKLIGRLKETKILLMSSDKDEELIREGIMNGANDFLHKPITFLPLLGRVQGTLEIIEQHRLEHQLKENFSKKRQERDKVKFKLEQIEKELKEIRVNAISLCVETPIEVLLNAIRVIVNGEVKEEYYRGTLLAILKTLGSDLYEPFFTPEKESQMDDRTKKWIESEFIASSSRKIPKMMNEGGESVSKLQTKIKRMSHLKDKMVEGIEEYDFNVWEHKDGDLFDSVIHMFRRIGCFHELFIDEMKFIDFINEIKEHYNESLKYHNFKHAVDVTQFCYCLILDKQISSRLTIMDAFCILLAAICHDVGHMGLTNTFYVNSGNDLALRYNDRSVIENYHACLTFTLYEKHRFFNSDKRELLQQVKETVIHLILGTDPLKHFEIFSKFKTASDTQTSQSPDNHLLFMTILLKCADLSNTCRPFAVYENCVTRLYEEFFEQGELEKKAALPVIHDRHTTDLPKTQLDYLDFIARPLFRTFSTNISKGFFGPLCNMNDNRSIMMKRSQQSSKFREKMKEKRKEMEREGIVFYTDRGKKKKRKRKGKKKKVKRVVKHLVKMNEFFYEPGGVKPTKEDLISRRKEKERMDALEKRKREEQRTVERYNNPIIGKERTNERVNVKGIYALIIEENPTYRESVKRMMALSGYICTSLDSCESAEKLLQSEAKNYDLVIYGLEKASLPPKFFDVLKELKKRAKAEEKFSPILFLSPFSICEERDRKYKLKKEMGDWLYEFIMLPVHKQELLSVVRSLIIRGLEKSSIIDTTEANELCCDDILFLEEMLGGFIHISGELMENIHNSFKEMNTSLLGSKSHSLKGSAAQLGLKLFSIYASDLELSAKKQDAEEVRASLERLEGHYQKVLKYFEKSEIKKKGVFD